VIAAVNLIEALNRHLAIRLVVGRVVRIHTYWAVAGLVFAFPQQ
jgi:hypothetical protein